MLPLKAARGSFNLSTLRFERGTGSKCTKNERVKIVRLTESSRLDDGDKSTRKAKVRDAAAREWNQMRNFGMRLRSALAKHTHKHSRK